MYMFLIFMLTHKIHDHHSQLILVLELLAVDLLIFIMYKYPLIQELHLHLRIVQYGSGIFLLLILYSFLPC